MGNVVVFTPRLATSALQVEPSISPSLMSRKSLGESIGTLFSSLASLSESLQKYDTLVCQIEDGETRARLLQKSEQIYREWVLTSNELLKAASVLSTRKAQFENIG